MKKSLLRKKIFKLSELSINYIVLILLIITSFLSRPKSINIDSFPEINAQYGVVYLILITFSICASIIIIWRLIRPNIGLRIVTFFIILFTLALTYIDYKPNSKSLYEIIRLIIFES
jgi:hypothetical protein